MSIGQELLNVPMGQMIREMAFAIAEAQVKLDEASIESAEMMGGLKTIYDDQGNITFDDSRVFFGAEYMPLRDALILHGGGNDAVSKYLSDNYFSSATTYKKWVLILNQATGEYSGSPSKETVDSTLKDVIEYNMQLRERLAVTGSNAPLSTEIAEINDCIEKNEKLIESDMEILDTVVRVPTRVSMLELGFAPTFYQFVDTIIEVKISISISRSTSSTTNVKSRSFSGRLRLFRGRSSITTSQVNATFSSKFSYSAEGSSLLRTKLVPVPTPALLEERIRALMDTEREMQQIRIEALKA